VVFQATSKGDRTPFFFSFFAEIDFIQTDDWHYRVRPTDKRVLVVVPELIEATRGGHEDRYAEWVTGRGKWMPARTAVFVKYGCYALLSDATPCYKWMLRNQLRIL
jgi:hypothetical protein